MSLASGILGLQSILCFLGFSVKKQATLEKNLKSRKWIKIRLCLLLAPQRADVGSQFTNTGVPFGVS